MKGGINKIIRNVNASYKGKTDFDKVFTLAYSSFILETYQSYLPLG
jgi:hypothetical protein